MIGMPSWGIPTKGPKTTITSIDQIFFFQSEFQITIMIFGCHNGFILCLLVPVFMLFKFLSMELITSARRKQEKWTLPESFVCKQRLIQPDQVIGVELKQNYDIKTSALAC